MSLTRRQFLQAASAAGCFLPLSGISQLACGASGRDAPLLLILFLRGGADGLHLVGPSADADYQAARPPELRVADSGDKAGLLLDRSLDPAAAFCLHPEAAALAELYRGQRLAIVHAVGLNDATRSHFVAQDLLERGIADEKRIGSVDNGWLSRALLTTRGMVPAYAATAATPFSLRGMPATLVAPDLSAGVGLPWGAPTASLLRSLAQAGNSPVHQAGLNALDVLAAVDRALPKEGNKVAPYRPAGKASYDGAGDLTRSLTSVARLAKMDAGLAVACVDHGGWDTHEGQQGRFANQVRQLSTGLAAFHEDMAAAGRPVVVLTMTEFGRRLRANRSGGTDHGHGACWLVSGDGVRGGAMYGKWPGLSAQKLDQGVDLAVTTDYRSVLAEVLRAGGLLAADALPGWRQGGGLGLFA